MDVRRSEDAGADVARDAVLEPEAGEVPPRRRSTGTSDGYDLDEHFSDAEDDKSAEPLDSRKSLATLASNSLCFNWCITGVGERMKHFFEIENELTAHRFD
jgi:hypothetical protein